MKTGRPMENPSARYKRGTSTILPGPLGAHNWQPMSFDPETGLVYAPIHELLQDYTTDAKFTQRAGRWNLGVTWAAFPDDPKTQAAMASLLKGYLVAWDPVAQKEVWRVPHRIPWNGGTLSTAGGLVFQGTGEGKLEAYDAKTGKTLWSFDNHAAVAAGPITYAVDGEQYVAVMSGYGSAFFLAAGFMAPATTTPLNSRLNVYKLGGAASAPAINLPPLETPEPPVIKVNAGAIARGAQLYQNFCAVCHGQGVVGGGVVPDLRRSPMIQDAASFRAIVGGQRAEQGMPNFDKWITAADRDAIRAYVAREAKPLYDAEQAAKKSAGAAAKPGR
jgi:quinohemoprotein ethanol dehydrogenase